MRNINTTNTNINTIIDNTIINTTVEHTAINVIICFLDSFSFIFFAISCLDALFRSPSFDSFIGSFLFIIEIIVLSTINVLNSSIISKVRVGFFSSRECKKEILRLSPA